MTRRHVEAAAQCVEMEGLCSAPPPEELTVLPGSGPPRAMSCAHSRPMAASMTVRNPDQCWFPAVCSRISISVSRWCLLRCPPHQGCGHQVSALSFPKNLVKRNVLFSANHSFPGLIALGTNNQAKDAFSGLHMSNLIFGITFSNSQHRSSKTISLRTETNPSWPSPGRELRGCVETSPATSRNPLWSKWRLMHMCLGWGRRQWPGCWDLPCSASNNFWILLTYHYNFSHKHKTN